MGLKKKILFIVPSMRGGGSERVISHIVKYFNKNKYEIFLALLEKEGPYLKNIPSHVNIVDLKTNRLRKSILKIIKMIYKLKPDIVMSTLSHINIFISIVRPFFSKKIKFIVRESNTVSINNKDTPYPAVFNALYKMFYNNVDLIIAQSEYMKTDLINNFNIRPEKFVVINNPVDIEKIKELSRVEGEQLFNDNKINLLAVGRLESQKGFDLLLQVLELLDERFYLTIIGVGKEKENLLVLAKTLNIQYKVRFLEFQENPYKFMKQADLFILSSRYEGFPNVVLEANACGTPVVAFNCPGGTNEIIIDDFNGFLVECQNINAMAKYINKAASTKWNNEKIIKNINLKYNIDYIIKKYESIL